ncbi:hypothetical protein ACHAP5_011518 [Fusarium lateritium]
MLNTTGLIAHSLQSHLGRDNVILTPPPTATLNETPVEGATSIHNHIPDEHATTPIATQATQSSNEKTPDNSQSPASPHESATSSRATSHEPDSETAIPPLSFTLTADEMGAALVENLARFLTQDGFKNTSCGPTSTSARINRQPASTLRISLAYTEKPGHRLLSANQVIAGVKIWILMATHHTTKFREFVDQHWGLGPCGMAVAHQSLMISPARLRKEEIDFANKGPCFAQSINFKLPGESLLCDRQETSLRHKAKSLKRGHEDSEDVSHTHKHSLQLIANSLRARGLVFTAPELTSRRLPDENTYRFAYVITSDEAFRGVYSIVDAWNKHVRTLEPEPEETNLPVMRRAKDDICKAAKWSNETFQYHMKAGRDFLDLSDGNNGMLPFYACFPKQAFGVVVGRKHWFDAQQLREVKKLLDTEYTRALFSVGKALQDAVEAKEAMDCNWTGQDVDWDQLEEEQVLAYLAIDAASSQGEIET